MSTPFELPTELTIYNVLEMRDALLAWVGDQDEHANVHIEISASKVEAVDGAGLQLLAALFNMDPPWRLIQPSVPFEQACVTMGLHRWLDQRTTTVGIAGERHHG